MPDRIVRTGILTSDPINALSWGAEVFYRRLMSVVDDYGRFDGRMSVLRAATYPLKLDKVSDADVGKLLTECVSAGLVSRYTVEGKEYICILKFNQRIQGKPKWPEPNGDSRESTVTNGDSPLYSETGIGVEDGGGDGQPQPLPPGFPKTVESAKGQCESTCPEVHEDFVRDVWEQAFQRRGKDAASTQIGCFSTYARRRWRKEQMKWETERKESTRANGSKWISTT